MIKNLLFDLGGVIMDIKRENAVNALTEIGMHDADKFLDPYVQKGTFLQLEEGKISPQQFREEIRLKIKGKVSDSQIDAAFSKFLLGIPLNRLKQLRLLREKGFKVFMLSNTNPIMFYGDIKKEFEKDCHDIDYYFDGIITSFEVKCCKPDPQIFQAATEKFSIKPEETLFFDDSKDNIKAAQKLGFAGCLIAPGTEFSDFIPQIIEK